MQRIFSDALDENIGTVKEAKQAVKRYKGYMKSSLDFRKHLTRKNVTKRFQLQLKLLESLENQLQTKIRKMKIVNKDLFTYIVIYGSRF